MKQEKSENDERVKQEQTINLKREIEKIKFEEKLIYEKKLEGLHSGSTANPSLKASKVK
jgi:hypothetical protein